jgi:hypothetical protein
VKREKLNVKPKRVKGKTSVKSEERKKQIRGLKD